MKRVLTLCVSLFMLVSCNGEATNTPQDNAHTRLMDQQLQSADSLEIQPTTEVVSAGFIPVGIKVPFNAVVLTADGTKSDEDYTNKLSWTTKDNNSVATIDQATGVLQALTPGNVTISAQVPSNSKLHATQTIQINNDPIDSVFIEAPEIANNVLPINTAEQLHAVGIFQSNQTFNITSSVIWTSNNPSVIEVVDNNKEPGLIKALTGNGSATITATWSENGTQKSAQVRINTSSAILQSINVQSENISINGSLPQGVTQQYKAYGYYNDGHVYDLTDVVQWQEPPVAAAQVNVSKHGLVTALASGQVTIMASYLDKIGKVRLAINNDTLKSIHIKLINDSKQQAVLKGGSVQFKAIGIYQPSGTSYDITKAVTWKSADNSYLTISKSGAQRGVATGLKKSTGAIDIMAKYEGVTSNQYPLMVLAAALANMQLTPDNQILYKNINQQYLAMGYSPDGYQLDLNYMATWRVSPSNIALVGNSYSNKGILTPRNLGAGTVNASIRKSGITESAVANFNVVDRSIKSIAINNAPESVAKGVSILLTAQATLTDDTTIDITDNKLTTWSSNNPDIIQYSGVAGKFIAISAGSASITASFNNPETQKAESVAVNITVNNTVITAVTVSPVSSDMPTNSVQQFNATLVDSAGNTYATGDFGLVTWSSNAATNLAIDPVTGLATAGTSAKTNITITATLDNNTNITGNATVNVVAAILQSINIKPHVESLAVGNNLTYSAEAIYASPALRKTLLAPSEVKWSVDGNPSIAKIDAYGRLTTTGTGTITVVAQLISNGKLDVRPQATSMVQLAIVAATVDQFESLEIRSDGNGSLAIGDTRHYSVIAHYAHHDDTNVDLNSLSWSSTKESVATINSINGSDDFGLATAKGSGQTVITAVLAPYNNAPAQVTLNVNADLKMESIIIEGSHQAVVHDVRRYKAFADYYVNGQLVNAHKDITNEVSWTINPASVGAFGTGDKSNQLTMLTSSNNAIIQATHNNESATFALTVAPAADSYVESLVISSLGGETLKQGETKQYKLTVYYNNLPSYDATNDARWFTESSSIADIDTHGKLTGINIGSTNVLAYYSSESPVSQIVHVVANTPANALESVWLIDAVTNHQYTVSESLVLTYKSSREFKLMAKYKDGNIQAIAAEDVNWISADQTKVSFNNGIAVALESNVKTAIFASYTDNGITKTTPLVTVNVPSTALSKLVINDAPESVAAGSIYRFSATGYFGTGDTTGTNPLLSGVKWVSSDTTKISFDDATKGEATIAANATGAVVISVISLNDSSIESHVTVQIVNGQQAELRSISIEPQNHRFIAAGETQQYKVLAHYANAALNHFVNPSEVRWSSDNESSIYIDPLTGVATAISPGSALISATYRDKNANTEAYFEVETVTDFNVMPLGGIHIYKKGLTAKANLIAFTESHGKMYVGSAATWTPANPTIVTITPGVNPSDPVTIKGAAVGRTAVMITYHGKISKEILMVTVDNDELNSISLLPAESVAIGVESLPGYYQVMGYYKESDNVIRSQLVTGVPLLISGNPAVATVNKADGTLTGLTQGSTTITANYMGKTAVAAIEVNPAIKLESLMVLPRIATTVPNNLVCYVVLARIGNHMINVSKVADIDAGAAGHSIAGANCRDSNSDLEGIYVKVAGQTTANPVEVKVSYANMTVAAGTLKVVALDTLGPISIDPVDQTIVGNSMHRGTYEQFIAHDDQNTDISGLVKWATSESTSLNQGANGLVYAPESAVASPNGVTITATYPGVNSATYVQAVSSEGYLNDPATPALQIDVLSGNGDNVGDSLPLHVGNKAYLRVLANYTDGTQDVSHDVTVLSANPQALAYNPLTGFIVALNPVADANPVGLNVWNTTATSAIITGATSGMLIHSGTISGGTISSDNGTSLASGVPVIFTLRGSYTGEDGFVDLTYDGFWLAGACTNGLNCGLDIIPLGRYAGTALTYGDTTGALNVKVKGFNPNNPAQEATQGITIQ